MVTATDLKQWLYSHVSQYAGDHDRYAEQTRGDVFYRDSAAALERLADHVQYLPDGDERLASLADAYPEHWSTTDLPASGVLQSRLASLTDQHDPDQFVTEYVSLELSALSRRHS